jgi:thiol-disulfide isomerase/thioredoxin
MDTINHNKLIPVPKKFLKVVLFTLFCFIHPAHAQTTESSNIHYITDTTANVDSLISRFKNKVIYVDIWATWCHPCRAELMKKKDIQKFADFAAQNDIVILYICCDRDGNSWKSFISENKLVGYHILVNPYINKDLHATFATVQNRNGVMKRSFYIPRHIIVNQQGMVE